MERTIKKTWFWNQNSSTFLWYNWIIKRSSSLQKRKIPQVIFLLLCFLYNRQYKIRRSTQSKKWKSVCVNVVERRCDFTDTHLFYFGMFLLRVQAKSARQSSSWVQIEFCPDKHGDVLLTLFSLACFYLLFLHLMLFRYCL